MLPLQGATPAQNALLMQRFTAMSALSALDVEGGVNDSDSSNSDGDSALAGVPAAATPATFSAGATNAAPADLSSPEGFVQSVWPHAQQAARELGVDPKVLVAQAALETGWGQSIMQHADGSSSHNLFGIKASSGWQGRQVTVPTLEYSNGIAVRTRASFRSYGSFADSFSDYVDFLKSNPRYSQALAQAGDPQRFASALQNAGYATDPAYARKISAIVNGDTLHGALAPVQGQTDIAEVKPSNGWPLS
jgi:flagellar protein FlgJ